MVAPTGDDTNNRRKWFIGGGAVVVVVIVAVVLALVLGKSTPKSALASDHRNQTTSQPSRASLVATAQQYGPALSTETAANQAWVAASGSIVADETKQNQRLQQDETTYNSNTYGAGCDAANYTYYPSCVVSEDQTAASAESDEPGDRSDRDGLPAIFFGRLDLRDCTQ